MVQSKYQDNTISDEEIKAVIKQLSATGLKLLFDRDPFNSKKWFTNINNHKLIEDDYAIDALSTLILAINCVTTDKSMVDAVCRHSLIEKRYHIMDRLAWSDDNSNSQTLFDSLIDMADGRKLPGDDDYSTNLANKRRRCISLN